MTSSSTGVSSAGPSPIAEESTVSIQDLTAIAGSEHVRAATAGDAIDGVMPRWVVEPGAAEEVSRLLTLANRSNLAIAPRGAGTKLRLGNPPARFDLVLDLRRMNRVLEHAAGDLVARMEAGTRLEDAQQVFAGAGQRLSIDPPERGATIGGIIAANASGPHRLRYGTMRDLLIGITYVLPDGTIAKAGGRVVKNVAGYDLCKLFTGSLGTLGVLCEVIVRLHPLPAARRMIVLQKTRDIGEAVQAILHSSLVPSAIELSYGARGTLAVLFEGVEPGVIAQAEKAQDLLQPYGEATIVPEVEWEPIPALAEGQSRLKVSTVPGMLNAVVQEIVSRVRITEHGGLRGHAGSGILYLDIDGEPAEQVATIAILRNTIEGYGGKLVVTAAPLAVKRESDVWGDVGDALPLMRRVKERFDPQGIMNPGRFVGGI